MRQGLTEKQLIILRLLAEGNKTKEIAKILENSPNTIENMRKSMMERTGALNVAHLIHISHKNGWL